LQIPLDIPDVEILKIEKNKTEDLIITVKSTKDFWALPEFPWFDQ